VGKTYYASTCAAIHLINHIHLDGEALQSAVYIKLKGRMHYKYEKIRPWGFYVHGCIDGYSHLILYLSCCSNKRSATVLKLFLDAVHDKGWPSRVRGDFGTENNLVEKHMVQKWGEAHRAYLRGRYAVCRGFLLLLYY
jgi:hypothetical protein